MHRWKVQYRKPETVRGLSFEPLFEFMDTLCEKYGFVVDQINPGSLHFIVEHIDDAALTKVLMFETDVDRYQFVELRSTREIAARARRKYEWRRRQPKGSRRTYKKKYRLK